MQHKLRFEEMTGLQKAISASAVLLIFFGFYIFHSQINSGYHMAAVVSIAGEWMGGPDAPSLLFTMAFYSLTLLLMVSWCWAAVTLVFDRRKSFIITVAVSIAVAFLASEFVFGEKDCEMRLAAFWVMAVATTVQIGIGAWGFCHFALDFVRETAKLIKKQKSK